jgi:HEPN domain-containing protein
MNPLVEEWKDKARKDWVSLEILLKTQNPDTAEAVCFLAQQCIEKLMKGLLVEKKVKPPKTHNLIELQFLLQEHHSVVLTDDLEELSIWAVESRYPGVIPTWVQACSAAESCRKLRTILLPFFET